jgi:hypothetical protein
MEKVGHHQPGGAARQHGHELPAFESRVQVGGVFIIMFHKNLRIRTQVLLYTVQRGLLNSENSLLYGDKLKFI